MMFPKQKRVKDKNHLKRLKSLPCYICSTTPCDPHHLMRVGGRGIGYKTGDDTAIPICRNHHNQLHALGEYEFFHLYGKNYQAVIDYAKRLYNNK